MTLRPLALAVLGLALAAGGPALADQKLPPDQQAKVEALLKQEGFTKWDEVELDDGMIEVDDAIDGSGKKVDLKIDPNTMAIVKRKAE
ncbi:PepSY domain-containing protein [Methylobacterium organophilum]|uniref:PepSY domain-containing protein n=1 Tax=Methylobacterium organophilum TaxID=410 RepID=UPI001F140A12|nr:PepSY domain-containing protein [Methylobacterium organophilum]UMY18049.1 PepSY domain-containing protein [Methylobacterium organophilum]